MFASLDLLNQTNIDENSSFDDTTIGTISSNQDLKNPLSAIAEGKN